MKSPDWQDVPQSSNIRRVLHDGTGMTVEFRSGAVYHYAGVPADMVPTLISSSSPGTYLIRNLVPTYGKGRKI